MRQKFLMRLSFAFLVLGLLSWGGSLSTSVVSDWSLVSVASAQDEDADAEEEFEDGAEEGAEDEFEDGAEEGAEDEFEDEAEEGAEDEFEDGADEGSEENGENNAASGNLDGGNGGYAPPPAGSPPVSAPTDFKAIFRTMDTFGGYAALWKVIAAILVYLAWVRSMDWVSVDCIHYGFNGKKWVPLCYGSFLGGMLLFWLIPFFWVSYLFLLAGLIVPVYLFVRMHNQDLSTGEQVLTPEHLRFVFAQLMAQIGVKVSAKARDRHEIGFPVILQPQGKNKVDTEAWRIQARAHDGFPNAREILSKLMKVHPEGLMLDFTATGVSSRYLLDGVWNASETFTRELGDPALQALKILCGMKPEDRKNKQEGDFKIEFEYDYTFPEDRLKIKHAEEELKEVEAEENKAKIREMERNLEKVKEEARAPEKRKRIVVVHLITQGIQSGERAVFQFEQGKSAFKSMNDLGMTDEMAAALKKQMGAEKGIFVFAAPPANGLRTTVKMALIKTDRYTREFYEVEDGVHKYDEIENVTQIPIHAKDLETYRNDLRSMFLKDPNVVVVRDVPFPEVMNDMLDEIENEGRFMITTIRAKDAAEALLRIMATKCDVQKWVKNVNGVLCQKLVRKLCEHCKESFVPPVETLRQVGATEKIKLYRQPAPPQPKPGEEEPQPCAECLGLGYAGRTALFELVVVGEETRKALLHTPKLELVRAALKKDGNHFMMSEGLRLVREGETSLQELKRALS